MIPYGKQEITQQDIDAVLGVLLSDFLTQGPQVPKFEEAIRHKVEAESAVAVNSATSALHIACLALGVGRGDSVWTVPISFVASANCALYCGAKIDFVEVDTTTYNMSISSLKEKLEYAAKNNCLPKVVIPVHLSGLPCDMKAISMLSKEYDFSIIEDASHAIGASYEHEPVGNCRYSDITVFSFHPVKIITTAEGGIATTNNLDLAKKMRLLRSHGVTRDPELLQKKGAEGWYYEQQILGFNYRMTDMQAALGVSQLERLEKVVEKRNYLARRYDELLQNLEIELPLIPEDSYSSFHLYIIRLKSSKLSRMEFFNYLRESGVGVNIHYIPIHTQPYYKQLGFQVGDFPVSEEYYDDAVSIPLFHTMTLGQQDRVIEVIKEALK